jgi:predicted P-loop ATPase
MLTAALKYAALGWNVLPVFEVDPVTLRCACGEGDRCTGPAKHPRVSHGLKDATTDPRQIEEWWHRWPLANIGVRTGSEGGFLCFDFDGEAGVALAESIRTPPTPWAITGSGGRHAFFAMPNATVSSRVRVSPGLDIRASGSYVVVPPSLHKSGQRYSWCEALSPWDTDPAPVTDELLPLIEPIKPSPGAVEIFENREDADELTVSRARKYVAKMRPAISGQNGSGDTFRAALVATRGFGLSKIQALDVTREYSARCSPPWSENELLHKVEDAYKSTRVPDRFLVDRPEDTAAERENKLDMKVIRGQLLPVPNQRNAAIFLENEPRYAGRIRYDEFARRVTLTEGSTSRPWNNADLLEAVHWFQGVGRELQVGKETAQDAVDFVAHRHAWHPVRDYLNSLVWDGTPRADAWLIDHAEAQDTPYVRAVSAKFLISAVARAFEPGCQADTVLVLEAPQGAGKSSAVQALGEPWASTLSASSLRGKEAAEMLAGQWIVELGELSSLARSDVENVKDFVTRRNDFFRGAYQRIAEDHKRQCVLIGTTNSEEYLRDESGGRRWHPVKLGHIDVEALRRERWQIWAEAVVRYLAGEPWHLSRSLEKLAEGEQEARRVVDSWEESIDAFLEQRTSAMGADVNVAVGEILKDGLGLPLERHDQASQNRVVRALKVRRWGKFRQSQGGRAWRYRPGRSSLPPAT